jgi:uncharacterized protein
MKKYLIILTGAIFISVIFSAVLPAEEAQYPSPSGYINDFAGLLSEKTEDVLDNKIKDLKAQTTAEVAVVTVETIAPESIEEYANKLFEKWGVGREGEDNGILILVAVKERKTRIEVGYGLEGAVTDAESSRIIEGVMLPFFKKGNFEKGIDLAVQAVIALVAKEYGVEIGGIQVVPGENDQDRASSTSPLGFFIFFLIVVIFIISLFRARSRGGRHSSGSSVGGGFWTGGGGGGFSGGSGGFGGGMSGGGGASGGW